MTTGGQVKGLIVIALVGAAAFGQDKPQDSGKVTATYTMAEIAKVAKNIYVCGKIDGAREAVRYDGRADISGKLDDLSKEAGCENISQMLRLLEDAGKDKPTEVK